ncbi:MAG: NERD domain-containing protein [Phycisphaeraceae bacterium]|nr:NERD domain-containing protein [Phycisphaeraceae bacterium]
MIVKPLEQQQESDGPVLRAGMDAERQMAHYLHRRFANDPGVYVLHDLRLVDPEQPEHDGRPGVCQIDHLLLHRWGAFIVESKSAQGEVAVRGDRSGGDEWTRTYKGRKQGIASPIQQARRQAEFLRGFLQRHRTDLVGKVASVLCPAARLLARDDQRGFRHMPIEIVVAYSDSATIGRVGGWTEPTKPFRTFVCKADTVADKVQAEVSSHRAASSLLGKPKGKYGIWLMATEEVVKVAEFLAQHHSPHGPGATRELRTAPEIAAVSPASPPARAAPAADCKHCGGVGLSAHWGQYGYYWKCGACGKNTPMPKTCGVCGAEGVRGRGVKIRKEGPKYFRACEKCGIDECIWVER